MPPVMVEQTCWRVFSARGRLQSVHADLAAAQRECAVLRRRGVSPRIERSTRRVQVFRQPSAPSAAQRHREAQADRMVVLRQATTYHKSGFNGTEIPSLPK